MKRTKPDLLVTLLVVVGIGAAVTSYAAGLV